MLIFNGLYIKRLTLQNNYNNNKLRAIENLLGSGMKIIIFKRNAVKKKKNYGSLCTGVGDNAIHEQIIVTHWWYPREERKKFTYL